MNNSPIRYELENWGASDNIINYAETKLMKLCIDQVTKNQRIHFDNVQHFYEQIKTLSLEEAKSLLYIELSTTNRFDELINYDDDDYRNKLCIILKNYAQPIVRFNELINLKLQWHLPEHYLDWFRDDLVASLFIADKTCGIVSQSSYRGKNEFLSFLVDFIKHNIYLFNSRVYNKTQYEFYKIIPLNTPETLKPILDLKNIFLTNQLEQKDINWIDAKNAEQVTWIHNELKRKGLLILSNVFFPFKENINELYDQILASLMVLSNSSIIYEQQVKNISDINDYLKSPYINASDVLPRSIVIKQLKKAWNTKVDRAKKSQSKTDNTIKIYKKNHDKLQELSQHFNISSNKLINQLISDEYEKLKELSKLQIISEHF